MSAKIKEFKNHYQLCLTIKSKTSPRTEQLGIRYTTDDWKTFENKYGQKISDCLLLSLFN
jgi:hypothetical protein